MTELVDELNEAIASVFDDRQCPLIAAVNTGYDMFAVVVASADIADAEAAYEMGPTSRGRKLTTPPRRRQPFAAPMCSQPSKR